MAFPKVRLINLIFCLIIVTFTGILYFHRTLDSPHTQIPQRFGNSPTLKEHDDDVARHQNRNNRRMSLKNTLSKVRARNAYHRPGNNDRSQWGFKTGGTGGFHSVDVTRAQTISLALQTTIACPWTLHRTNCVSESQFDGGKWTCGLEEMRTSREQQPLLSQHSNNKTLPPCIVYSFGSNGDDFFENDVQIQSPYCEIHIFDPTAGDPPAAWEEKKYHFHKLGLCVGNISSFTLEGTNTNTRGGGISSSRSYPCQSLSNIMKDLGHSYVDIMKADVEGMEWKLLENWRSEARVGQVLFELHFWHQSAPKNIVALLRSIIIPLEKLGYFIQTVEPVAAKIDSYEVTFLNANWSAETAFAHITGNEPVYYNPSMYPSTPNVDIP